MKKNSLKILALPGLIATTALLLTGCSVLPTATPNPQQNTISIPDPKDGSVPLAQLPPALATDEYIAAFGPDEVSAREASKVGLATLQIFTTDYGKYRTGAGELSRDEALNLLPEVEGKLTPLMNPATLAAFSEQWRTDILDKEQPESSTLMLAIDGNADKTWKNDAGLQCGVTDTEWKTTFSDAQMTAVPVQGQDYKAAAYTVNAHYLIPCAEGKFLQQKMKWTITLGPDASNSKWEVYQWERKPSAPAKYLEQ